MLEEVRLYIFIFFIYSFLGWVMESTMFTFIHKKFVNRGFLVGPVCPVYGFGAVFISLLLKDFEEDILFTFILSLLICGLLEYFTSYIMEVIFKARWWDYSKKKFNINGRVCLKNLILFGIAGVTVTKFINPLLIDMLNLISASIQNVIAIILIIVILVDYGVSFKIIINLKKVSSEVKDNTIEISEKVRKIIHSKSILYRRLVESFPLIKEKVNYIKWDIKGKIESRKRSKR